MTAEVEMADVIPPLDFTPPSAAASSSSAAAAPPPPPAAPPRSGGPGFISVMHVISSAATDPRWELNVSNATRLAAGRFELVPNQDAFLCYGGLDVFRLHPPTTPNYIPQTLSEQWKLRSILDQRSLGVVDNAGMSITLNSDVARAIQAETLQKNTSFAASVKREQLMEDEDEESKEGAAAAAASSSSSSHLRAAALLPPPTLQFRFHDYPPLPPHAMYPISVQLNFRLEGLDDLRANLQRDVDDIKHNKVYTDTVWPRAIKYYKPVAFHCVEVKEDDESFSPGAAHYVENVLSPGEGMDPFFDVGLFGRFRNGLSVVLLALSNFQEKTKIGNKMPKTSSAAAASSASSADRPDDSSAVRKVHSLLCQYITLVSLQFWTMVHSRWLELDPQEASPSKSYLPLYLFYFHHFTDFTQSNRVKRCKKGHKDGDRNHAAPVEAIDITNLSELTIVAKGPQGEGAFMGFLAAVFKYVLKRMDELIASTSDEHRDIRLACRRLRLSSDFVEDHGFKFCTNHTQSFTCARFKAHPLNGMGEVLNRQFRSGLQHHTQVIDASATPKFFPCNKDDVKIKMKLPKAAAENKVCAETRYILPYFWSHLLMTPDSPLVRTEVVFDLKRDASIGAPVHQASVLRRLMFCMNSTETAIIKDLFDSLGDCEMHFSGSARPMVSMPAPEFYKRFIESAEGDVHLKSIREHTINAPVVLLPPVIPPAASRYCMYLDGFTGRTMVPALSRDFSVLPTVHESDVTCMTKFTFCRAFYKGIKSVIVKNADTLQSMNVISRESELCQKLLSTEVAKLDACKALSGLSASHSKLNLNDPHCDWAYQSGRFRLNRAERAELCKLVTGERLTIINGVHYDLWNLLSKICVNEPQLVASYVYHVATAAWVKKEENVDPLDLSAISEWRLGRYLRKLQEARYVHQQVEVEAFTAVWGAHLPAKAKKRARDEGAAAAASSSASSLRGPPNPYWPAQSKFLSSLDARWNHCQKPIVEGTIVSQLVRDMLDVDLAFFEFSLSHADPAGGLKQPRSLFHAQDGTVSEANQVALRAYFHSMTTQAYERYSWTSKGDVSCDFLQQKKSSLQNVLPGFERNHGYDRLEVKCTAASSTKLLQCFQYFFSLQPPSVSTAFSILNFQTVLAFFFWYYYTQFLRPFCANMGVLYPDSSLIQYKAPKLEARTWIQSLIPADPTPVLSKILFTLLSDLTKKNIFGELETAVQHNSEVTERAETALLAAQMAIRAQDEVELEDAQNQKLVQVYDHATTLLARKHQNEGVNAVVPTSGYYQSNRKWSVQKTATQVIVTSLLYRKTIPDAIISQLFIDLSAVIEPGEDPCVSIAAVFVHVLKELKTLQNMSAIDTLFRTLDIWSRPAALQKDQLLVNVAKHAMKKREFAR